LRLIDANVFIYARGAPHPYREACRHVLAEIQAGREEANVDTEVLQEILYRYGALHRLDLAASVYDLFVQLCPVVLPVTLADTDRAKSLFTGAHQVGVRDAVHAAVMLNNDVTSIATFDAGFDRVPGLSRVPLV